MIFADLPGKASGKFTGGLGESFEIVRSILAERVSGHEVDDMGDGIKFDVVMQRARQVHAAEGLAGPGELGEAGRQWFGDGGLEVVFPAVFAVPGVGSDFQDEVD